MLIPRTAFEAHRCCAREDSRYAVNGIRIARKGKDRASIAATDGRQLAIVEWQDVGHPDRDPGLFPMAEGGDPMELYPVEGFVGLIEAGAAKDALKLAPANGITRAKPVLGNVALVEEKGARRLRLSGMDGASWKRAEPRAMEERFPDYEGVIPPGQGKAVAKFNPALMANLLTTLAKAVGAQDLPMAEFHCYGPDTPTKVIVTNLDTGITATGVIMPISGS